MSLVIGIVGGTGAVGEKILQVLMERNVDVGEIRLFASKNSNGKKVYVEKLGKEVEVEELTEEVLKDKFDYLFFAAGGEISKKYGPIAAEAGNIVIDNSSHFRMDESIPLVVPEINGHLLKNYRGIISNPNCSTTQMVVALGPLQRYFGIEKIVVSTYQAVSGSGYGGIKELEEQRKDDNYGNKFYPKKIYGNCIPHIDSFMDNGFTKEELKMVHETHKIFNDYDIRVNPTAVRVPVVYGHSESIYVELKSDYTMDQILECMCQQEGLIVMDDPSNNTYPTPVDLEDKDGVFVGRIRQDLFNPRGLSMWVVADNLRKGAATNAVQILEKMEILNK